MSHMALIPNAQNAVLGHRCLVAVINRATGRQITNLLPDLISEPLVEIRCAGLGFGWHDCEGNEWFSDDGDCWHQ